MKVTNFIPREKIMTKFLTKSLYTEMDDLIDRLDNLRETLEEARDVEEYEEFDNLMDTARERAQLISYDVDYLKEKVSELHSKEK